MADKRDKQYFPVLYEWDDTFQKLSDNQLGKLIRIMMGYSKSGKEPEMPANLSLLFSALKPQLDHFTNSYEEICEKRREAGKKGGRPRKDTLSDEPESEYIIKDENQKNQLVNLVSETKAKKPIQANTIQANTIQANTTQPPEGGTGETGARLENDADEVSDVVREYHSRCPSMPRISINAKRVKAIRDALDNYGIDILITVFDRASASSFLNGAGERGWKASLDWLLAPDNIDKVLAGNYDNANKASSGNPFADMLRELEEEVTS